MSVALGGADRHPRRLGDLFERVAHRVLEHDHLRLPRRDLGERVAQLAAQLGHAGRAVRIAVGPSAKVVAERLVHARVVPFGRVTARVDDEAVEPRGELRVAAKLADTDAHLRERLLGRVPRILGVAQEMAREALDAGRVPRTQRVESEPVAVLRPRDEDRVAQLLVGEDGLLTQRLPNGLQRAPPEPAATDPTEDAAMRRFAAASSLRDASEVVAVKPD